MVLGLKENGSQNTWLGKAAVFTAPSMELRYNSGVLQYFNYMYFQTVKVCVGRGGGGGGQYFLVLFLKINQLSFLPFSKSSQTVH